MKILAQSVLIATLAVSVGWAWQPSQTEILNYRVSWGPIQVGKASLTYNPPTKPGAGYGIQVLLNDTSSLVKLNSTYRIAGRHTPRLFTSARYHAMQQENDYRADKVVTFDGAKRQVRYVNQRDANDTIPPLAWNGQLRDVFSQLYAMRLGGLKALQKGQELQVMGTKRPFTLIQMAPTVVAVAKNERPRYRVPLLSKKDDGSLAKDRWFVTLREETDGAFTPIKIEAQTKFGTFTAALR